MLRYRRFNEFIAVSLDPLKGFRFVLLHQAAVSDNVSGENGGELAFHERAPLANPSYATSRAMTATTTR